MRRFRTLRRDTRLGYIPTTMPRPEARRAARAALVAILGTFGCRAETPRVIPPPAAEFLVAAGDSAFWVRSDGPALRVRRAPLTLANVDGRFYELYVADDDRSYFDALLVGQRIYRRDLLSGDSVEVFADRRVADIARAFAKGHPEERPLAPHEEGSDDPHTVATSEATLLNVVGPLLSFEHHRDIDIVSGEQSHETRHGVIDLRRGAQASLHQVFGDTIARRLIAQGRAAYRVVLDSVRRSGDRLGPRAARVIDAFRFDSTSFAIDDIDGAPMVAFFVPGAGVPDGAFSLPLPHLRAPFPTWWRDVEPTIPRLGPDSLSEVWGGSRYDVVARYDSTGEFATIVVRDTARNEWTAGRLPTPARRVYRLDGSAVDSSARHALARAFDESTLYSASARTVAGPVQKRPRLVPASNTSRINFISGTHADFHGTRRNDVDGRRAHARLEQRDGRFSSPRLADDAARSVRLVHQPRRGSP